MQNEMGNQSYLDVENDENQRVNQENNIEMIKKP